MKRRCVAGGEKTRAGKGISSYRASNCIRVLRLAYRWAGAFHAVQQQRNASSSNRPLLCCSSSEHHCIHPLPNNPRSHTRTEAKPMDLPCPSMVRQECHVGDQLDRIHVFKNGTIYVCMAPHRDRIRRTRSGTARTFPGQWPKNWRNDAGSRAPHPLFGIGMGLAELPWLSVTTAGNDGAGRYRRLVHSRARGSGT